MRFFSFLLFFFVLSVSFLSSSVLAEPFDFSFLSPPSGSNSSSSTNSNFRLCLTGADESGQFGDWGFYNFQSGQFSFGNFPHGSNIVGASFQATIFSSGTSGNGPFQYTIPGCCTGAGISNGLICYFPAAGPVSGSNTQKPIRISDQTMTVVQLTANN